MCQHCPDGDSDHHLKHEVCLVCQRHMKHEHDATEIYKTTCGHEFHLQCVLTAVFRSQLTRCPACNLPQPTMILLAHHEQENRETRRTWRGNDDGEGDDDVNVLETNLSRRLRVVDPHCGMSREDQRIHYGIMPLSRSDSPMELAK